MHVRECVFMCVYECAHVCVYVCVCGERVLTAHLSFFSQIFVM